MTPPKKTTKRKKKLVDKLADNTKYIYRRKVTLTIYKPRLGRQVWVIDDILEKDK